MVADERRLIRSARDAEAVARDWMRRAGFSDARLTALGADGGVDVLATGAVAQVKAEVQPCGARVVREIAGIAGVDSAQALVFALGGYTAEAKRFAARAGVGLFRFTLQSEVEPANEAARQLAARPAFTAAVVERFLEAARHPTGLAAGVDFPAPLRHGVGVGTARADGGRSGWYSSAICARLEPRWVAEFLIAKVAPPVTTDANSVYVQASVLPEEHEGHVFDATRDVVPDDVVSAVSSFEALDRRFPDQAIYGIDATTGDVGGLVRITNVGRLSGSQSILRCGSVVLYAGNTSLKESLTEVEDVPIVVGFR